MAEISKVRFGGVDYDLKSITDTSLSESGTPADAMGTRLKLSKDSETVINTDITYIENDSANSRVYVHFTHQSGHWYLRGRSHATITYTNYLDTGLVGTSPSGVQYCWIIPYDNSLIFNLDTNKVEVVPRTYDQKSNSIFVLYVSTSGTVWTNKGLYERYLISKTNDTVSELSTIIESIQKDTALPDYQQEYIEAKTLDIAEDNYGDAGVSDRFIFITDVHLRGADGTLHNSLHSPLLMKYLHDNANIGLAFFGGDAITGAYTDDDSVFTDLSFFRKTFAPVWDWMHCMYGNHDYGNNNSSRSPLNKAYLYNLFIKDKERQYADVNPVYGSYVLDNHAQKIRYIVLNLNEGSNLTQQATWFCTKMRDTPAGWTIVFLTHFSLYDNSGTLEIASKLTATNSIIPAIEAYNAKSSMAGVNFSECGATIACVIGGHCHFDGMVRTQSGVPVIATTCDRRYDYSWRVEGTVSEQAFDVFSINTSSKTIKATRIGYGEDRQFTY